LSLTDTTVHLSTCLQDALRLVLHHDRLAALQHMHRNHTRMLSHALVTRYIACLNVCRLSAYHRASWLACTFT
jgi:predicted LPLAT superfamily acyltransferase